MAKIMVVDDSGLSRRVSRKILEDVGHLVVDAEDGMAALERYFLERPELVLLDVTMKGMNGIEVLLRLRELDPGARVIIVTADVQNSTRQLTGEGGACGFVTKPISVEPHSSGCRRCPARGHAVQLTALQEDAVTELINIAFSRTAASLSEITKNRVDLEVPQISVHPIDRLWFALGPRFRGKSPRYTKFSRDRWPATPFSCSISRAPPGSSIY